MQRDGAVFLELDGGAVDTARSRRLFHFRKDRHVARGISSSRLHANDDTDTDQTAFVALSFLFLAQFVEIDLFSQR